MAAEITVSSLVARALDRLLFEGELVSTGACLHQGPTRKQQNTPGGPECADVLITKFSSNYPSTPVLVSDIKKGDLLRAGRETTCYSINVAAVRHATQSFPVVLALPTTLAKASLELHVAVENAMWRIPIVNAPLTEKALLLTLCATVRYLCTTEPFAHSEALTTACPFKQGNYEPLGNYRSSQLSNCRVFLKENVVYKLYDKESELEHNESLLKTVGALKEVNVQKLTSDGNVTVLSYRYIAGTHTPSSLKQFAAVIRVLGSIHEQKMVHGDIRQHNIIFPFEAKEGGVLLDFDLARREGTTYPEGYNEAIVERHEDAKRGNLC